MGIKDKVDQIKMVLAVLAVLREVLKNDELKGAAIVLLDTIYTVARAAPGEFPDNAIRKLLEFLGEEIVE